LYFDPLWYYYILLTAFLASLKKYWDSKLFGRFIKYEFKNTFHKTKISNWVTWKEKFKIGIIFFLKNPKNNKQKIKLWVLKYLQVPQNLRSYPNILLQPARKTINISMEILLILRLLLWSLKSLSSNFMQFIFLTELNFLITELKYNFSNKDVMHFV
jgi:hypothetical protein